SRKRTTLAPLLTSLGIDQVLMLSPLSRPNGVSLHSLSSPGLAPVSIRAELVAGRFLPSTASLATRLPAAAAQMLSYLNVAGVASTAQLQSHCPSVAPTRARTLIAELVHAGFIY